MQSDFFFKIFTLRVRTHGASLKATASVHRQSSCS